MIEKEIEALPKASSVKVLTLYYMVSVLISFAIGDIIC